MTNEIWQNLKTNKFYKIYNKAIDATNERDGTRVIVYYSQRGELFVREEKEFRQKFEHIASES